MSKRGAGGGRRWLPHLAFWLAIAVATPLGLWAYAGAGLELDLAMLLSFCSSAGKYVGL